MRFCFTTAVMCFAALAAVAPRSASAEDVYPVEVWPDSTQLLALNGAIDPATGIPHIARGTGPSSPVSLELWARRQFDRIADIVAHDSQLRVVKTAGLRVGVFPGDFTLSGARQHYAGVASAGQAELVGDDVYYVYLDQAGGLQIVTDAVGWPAQVDQCVPLAEVTVAGATISGIVDRRGWGTNFIGSAEGGGSSAEGTASPFFVLDDDNAAAGVNVELRANRGSSGQDAAWRWSAAGGRWEAIGDVVTNALGPLAGSVLTSTAATGTAPLVVASSTKVANLQADSVDGVSFTAAPSGSGQMAYGSANGAVSWLAAPAAGQVLIASGAGLPVWQSPGAASGLAAYDGDLAAIAASTGSGFAARVLDNTWVNRSIASGDAAIAVSNGGGVAGNPTLSIATMTPHGVVLGSASGSITTLAVPSDNTLLAGRAGQQPVFRKLVNADIDTAAQIDVAKLHGPYGSRLLQTNAGVTTWVMVGGDLESNSAGDFQLKDNAVGTADIEDNAVTIDKLAGASSLNNTRQMIVNLDEDQAMWRDMHPVVEPEDDLTLPADADGTTYYSTTQGHTFTLPAAAPGLKFGFVNRTLGHLEVVPASGDLVMFQSRVSTSGQFIAVEVNCAFELLAVDDTYWVVTSMVIGDADDFSFDGI